LCNAVADEFGKSVVEVLGGEVLPIAEACRFLLRRAARALRPRHVSAWLTPLWLLGQTDFVERRPRGVIGLIGTWNFPLLLNAVPILQALTAGNGILWKPSELAPRSAEALFAMFQRAGYPQSLIELLPSTRDAGQALALTDVDHMLFTGSSTTGRQLAETLGRRLISSTLELSGCDAMFVLDDADLSLAARAAWFGMTVNRGQTCVAVRRVFVHRTIAPAFLEHLRPLAAAAKPAALAQPAQAQLARHVIHDALHAGASILVPYTEPPSEGLFTPTVLTGVQPSMALCQSALFAPILGVLDFDQLSDALAANAQCRYALGAAIFSSHPDRAAPLARDIPAGMVTINDVLYPTTHPATPFGGQRASGWGVTQGEEGLLEMTVPQVVTIRRGRWRPHYDLALKNDGNPQMIEGFLEAGHGTTLRQRIRGYLKLMKSLIRK
jgi:acyl-CoA reductase-like NAD-dependent aldehyde dehydrogenase